MKTNSNGVLHSAYIIDGVPQDLSPASILEECAFGILEERRPEGVIVDESLDPAPGSIPADLSRVDAYLDAVLSSPEVFPLMFADAFSRNRIAQALIEVLFRRGHFCAGDLQVALRWRWNDDRVGNMAAFYQSVQASADYLDRLDIRLASYEYAQSCDCSFDVEVSLGGGGSDAAVSDNSIFDELPYRSQEPVMQDGTAVHAGIVPDSSDWLIYIPFDTCEYRFGGSAFALSQGYTGTTAPQVDDPDYFLDCYEVVRELVEDGIVKAGAPVGRGGLLACLQKMSVEGGVGIVADLSALSRSSGQESLVKLAFSEVPGVVVQIPDEDFDYVDAELLLQDVAFYPLGHPVPGKAGASILTDRNAEMSIETILKSLINK